MSMLGKSSAPPPAYYILLDVTSSFLFLIPAGETIPSEKKKTLTIAETCQYALKHLLTQDTNGYSI